MNKIFKYILPVLMLGALSSCLKDKNCDDHVTGHNVNDVIKVSELGVACSPEHNRTIGVDFVDVDTSTIFLTVRLASAEPATEDIIVTIDTTGSQAMIDAYNDENDAEIELLTPDLFTFKGTGLKVTIPKGQNEGHVSINFNPTDFDPSYTYALGFKIKSVDKSGYAISQNFGKYLTLIGAKNDYDGFYEITGTLVDANGLYMGDYGDPAAPRQYTLATVGAQTGLFYDVSWDYANYIVINIATGGAANTGIRPKITFDGTTRAVVSAVNANNNAVLTIGPGSKFNESDHSIDLQWTLGRWKATEHWKYLGPR